MYHLPGYAGYQRNFQRDFVSGTTVPSRKYQDFEAVTHSLMADDRWCTEAQRRFDAPRLLHNQRAAEGGTTRLQPSHKESRQAARIAAQMAEKHTEEKEQWNWQTHVAGISSGEDKSLSPRSNSLLPRAGRARKEGALYRTTYSDSIGVGTSPAPPPAVPRFPYKPAEFSEIGADQLPPLDNTLNKSLAQAISSLPAADNLIKANVGMHGSYSRDFGQRGHHPLQRNAGITGSAPPIEPGHMTLAHARSTYPSAEPTHAHLFPSSSLIGPSGAKKGPNPVEGRNQYAHTNYRDSSERPGSAGDNPFLQGSKINVCDIATTRELFAGSTKGSSQLRIPKYSGFIPAAHTNQASLTGTVVPSASKDILHTFKHDMPGYTGHQPSSVHNLRGPRSPRGKKRLPDGLIASLILDSMKI